MPVRTRSQRTGDAGQNFVRQVVDAHPSWMCRAQDLDFGVDLEAELAPTAGEDQRPTGKLLKLQVKASEAFCDERGHVAVSLEREFLDYAGQFRIPVLLVAVKLPERRAWWLWLQAWLLDNERRLASGTRTATVTVHIPAAQTLELGVAHGWRPLAEGHDPTAMVLALRDLAAVAGGEARHIELFSGVLALLDKLDAANRVWTAEKIIDALIGLGPNSPLWLSSELVPQLLTVVDRMGDVFSTEQVVRMVARGHSYSRAALYGLTRLYDRWPEHAHSLRLPQAFQAAGVDAVAWYCSAREHYPELSSFSLWSAFAAGELPTTRFGNCELVADADVPHRLWSKWPNRGDSVLLDNLISLGGPATEAQHLPPNPGGSD
jgi:hypothetical protein